ncbi:YhcN/YlaJ family sporulation lipoprotein [Fictibacillus nanhaiensis]|uniref:YhcN/YlaJ family sporulation lipoprotein n=1 Tax=Fictibacillus nanhaiensis TaxID=742169 RepID=A0ABS2ZWH6_9BACL|nr:YhcN/YlaJ family sporulation lipoprotein [Fictibacillus nanhaiensis]
MKTILKLLAYILIINLVACSTSQSSRSSKEGTFQNLNYSENGIRELGYDKSYDSGLSSIIKTRVNHIKHIHESTVVLANNLILIGIKPDKKAQKKVLYKRINSEVRKISSEKNIQVITDKKIFNRIQSIDSYLKAGRPYSKVKTDVDDLLIDIEIKAHDLSGIFHYS